MSPNGVAILRNPHPRGHIVYPYTEEKLVAQAVCLYASAGISDGEGVILVMTRGHARTIDRRLNADGFDTARLQRTGQLTCCIAEDLLPLLLRDGTPDQDRFNTLLGNMIRRSRATVAGDGRHGRVRVFGEMVSLLLSESQGATERLEELWDGLIELHSISLLCAYALGGPNSRVLPETLIRAHSHNISGTGL